MTGLAAFLGIAVLVIVTPGQDTALTIRNTLLGGRAAGVATALGVVTGQAAWAAAASAGVVAVLLSSQPAFLALKLAGTAYLVLLGLHALRDALRPGRSPVAPANGASGGGRWRAYRQGVVSNLSNPKMAVFFASLLPQLVGPGASLSGLLGLGALFCSMTMLWLTVYAVAVARAGDLLRRGPMRRALNAVTGVALIAFGVRLAAAPR